jgi:beta-lactamase superfamily II metal-dependent hydrolase
MRIGLLAIAALTGATLLAQQRPLKIYWTDVEGGGATLVVTPSGESILIDTGMDLERDASRVAAVAKTAGLKQIDHVVLTHWHADHYGGVNRLSHLIPLKAFYDHGIPSVKSLPDDPSYPQLIALYKKVTGGHTTTLNAGDTLRLKNSPGVMIECLASNRKVAKAKKAPSGPNPACAGMEKVTPDDTDNANSIALKLTYGGFTFYDGGDLTRDIEQKLVCPQNLAGTVDIFQTDGHGMDVSNDATFIRSLAPRVVVVNNGSDKGAEPKTMKAIFATPGIETVWQVHRNEHNPDSPNTKPQYIANMQAKCKAEFLEASVNQDGSFTVQKGASGTPQRYKPR